MRYGFGMARVGQQIAGLGEDRLPGQIAVGVLTKVFPPSLVDEVVAAAGVGEQRIRVLPARLVVYYNLAMIVFFQSSYGQVWTKLVGGLGWAKSFRMRVAVGMSPSPAAISKARSRLGWQVMADLLDRVAGPLAGRDDGWAHVAGLRLVAFDGLTVDVPDTAVNAAAFGRPGGGLGAGAFPQVRVVALAECGSRALMGARCAGITVGEQTLTAELTGLLSEGLLVVADRNLCATRRFIAIPAQPGGIGGTFLDPMAYPDPKGNGDRSMPAKTGDRVQAKWSDAPGGPHDMAKAGLPES